MQKIIVTGGLGYIGSHTAVELLNENYAVIIVDNLANSNEDVLTGIQAITGRKAIFEKLDLTDKSATNQFFQRHTDAKAVIHFAALKAVGESVDKPLAYYQNNIGSLLNVLECMMAREIRSFIFSSSATVYGQPDKLPVTELSPVLPAMSPYGNTKQIGEEMIADIVKAKYTSLSAISLRYFNPTGAHPSLEIGELPLGVPLNLMPFLTQSAAGVRGALQVFGGDYGTPDGTAIRDYIHVVDVARAHVAGLERLLNIKVRDDYEVFNIGTGKGYSILEVIESFQRTADADLRYEIVDRRPGDAESIFTETALANEKLGWKTQFELDDMTKTAWGWEKKIRNL